MIGMINKILLLIILICLIIPLTRTEKQTLEFMTKLQRKCEKKWNKIGKPSTIGTKFVALSVPSTQNTISYSYGKGFFFTKAYLESIHK